jgi:hypothetical protein
MGAPTKSLLLFRGGIRTITKTLADGQEHKLYYKARTPNELAHHFGAEEAFSKDADGQVARQKHRARFIADAMCNEDGTQFVTIAEAEKILGSLKAELCNLIIVGSNEIDSEAGKD